MPRKAIIRRQRPRTNAAERVISPRASCCSARGAGAAEASPELEDPQRIERGSRRVVAVQVGYARARTYRHALRAKLHNKDINRHRRQLTHA